MTPRSKPPGSSDSDMTTATYNICALVNAVQGSWRSVLPKKLDPPTASRDLLKVRKEVLLPARLHNLKGVDRRHPNSTANKETLVEFILKRISW